MSGTPVYEGTILAGKYRVEKVLGAGGMGVVVAATHLQLEQRVALKFLTEEALGSGEAVARFAREARAAVRIKSEHVARVIDVGTLESGAPYMVMEYLEGSDLAGVLQKRGALPIADAVEYVLQACEALAEAHVLGIIHRDLKPANLFLIRRPDGTECIKVLDFGISKVMPGKGSSSDPAMTRTRAVMGSPLYMSPEQMASTRDVDGRTDVWALGVILFELLSGQPPFQADTMPQLCAMVLNAPAPSVRSLAPGVPSGLATVVSRSLERDVARRYANVAELASALADYAPPRAQGSIGRIARVMGSASAEIAAAPARVPTVALHTARSWVKSGSEAPSAARRAALWTGVIGLAVAMFAAAAWELRRGRPTTASMSAAPSAAAVHVTATADAGLGSEESADSAAGAERAASSAHAEPGASARAPASATPKELRRGAGKPVGVSVAKSAPAAVPTPAAAPTPAARAPAVPDLFDERK